MTYLDKIKELREGFPFLEERRSDILYITACTGQKSKKDGEIEAYKRYIGQSSKKMLDFYAEEGSQIFDMYVMSAGYGLIPADKKIKEYDVTFSKNEQNESWMNAQFRRKMVENLSLGDDFKNLIRNGYKLIILRLGGKYIDALNSGAPKGGYDTNGVKICYLGNDNKVKLSDKEHSIIKIKVCEDDRVKKDGRSNYNYQDMIWYDFFYKNKNFSTDEIINKIINCKDKNVKELLQ